MAKYISGINVHTLNSTTIKLVKNLKLKYVRIDANWNSIEPRKNSYNFRELDSSVSLAIANGMIPYITISYVPAWVNSDFRACPSTEDWAKFCQKIATRYRGKCHHYSCWNEPNLKTYSKLTIKQYFKQLLPAFYSAIKGVDKNNQILALEISTLSSGKPTKWLREAKKYKKYFDKVAIHCYVGSGNGVARWFRFGKHCPFGFIIPQWWPLNFYLNNIGKDVWLTETGWKTNKVSEKDQLKYIKELDKSGRFGRVKEIFLYDLIDDKNSKEKWGLYKSDNTPKKAVSYFS